MNKLIRGILYITAGCLGIGIAALILSHALGGNFKLEDEPVLEKAKKAAHDIVADAHNQVSSHHNNSTERAESEDDYEVTYTDMIESEGEVGLLAIDASAVSQLQIDLHHGSLSVEESDDSCIRVFADEAYDGISAVCESDKIIIQDNRSGRQGREDVMIYLEIPESIRFQTVEIRADAGVLETDCMLKADKLTVDADAGEILLSEVKADSFAASVGAGTVDIEDGVFETVNLECGVGTIEVEASITGDAQLECGMGTIDLELDGKAEDYNYVLNCGAGSIEIEGHDYTGLAKERRIENGASSTFKLNCGMGTICIEES